MVTEKRLLKNITILNWIIFSIMSMLGFILSSLFFASGIFLGGLLVTLNFYLLGKTLQKALTPPHLSTPRSILIKYYIRFTVSGIVIFVLIMKQYVDPLGLVLGLSTVVASIMLSAIYELKFLIVKEAV